MGALIVNPDAELTRLANLSRRLGTGARSIQGSNPNAINQGSAFQTTIEPWWIDFPSDGRYYDKSGTIATPALATVLATVLSFTAPPGWDGVIKEVSQNYVGGGFVHGSGDLLWTIRRAGAVEVEYNAKSFELGSVEEPTTTTIIFHENELIEYLVTVSATAGIPIAGTMIICRMKGWLVPRR